MRRELRHIPPAPRVPRWPPVLWARWPLAFLAFLGAIYGGVITLMFQYAWGGKPGDDDRLDENGLRVVGAVTGIDEIASRSASRPLARVHFGFSSARGESCEGVQFATRDAFALGQQIDIEYLADRPQVCRIHGTRLTNLANLAVPLWRWFVLPGLASLGLWLLGVWRTRSLLRAGDIAVAELVSVRPVAFVLPGMLRVSYRFLDRHARERRGRHWVRRRSVLGDKLLASPPPDTAPVVHHRLHPWRSRIVTVDDFVLAPASPHLHADAATPWTHDP
ncbi:MAG: hypothetical protein R3F56_12705 [Planctomycetota bacterium]